MESHLILLWVSRMDDATYLVLLESFALNLRVARVRAGMSQEELAHLAGLDRSYVSGTERAMRNPSLKTIVKLADALSVRIEDLLSGCDIELK